MLTLADQGALVVVALNLLPHPHDLVAGKGRGCCPDCCTSCEVLRRLATTGQLDVAVRQAPHHLWGPDSVWWVNGRVDTGWLSDCWASRNRPQCEHAA